MFARALSARGPAVAYRRSCISTKMPLRAKIMVPQAGARSHSSLSSDAEVWKPVPGDEPEDVVFTSIYGLRTIELNRPTKLNPLNGSMIRKIAPRLIEWQKSDMANVVVMKGAGNALCAGGDVVALALDNRNGEEGSKRSDAYFALEYTLDHLIATYQKPYIAFMDGFTMGGGVGLSIHAPFRIATERTVFAMPETTIGFFPDVGASFFLPRLPGAVGTYLALTSDRLTAANVFYAGIATHYLHSTTLPMLEQRLSELRFKDFDTLDKRLYLVNETIEEYTTGLPHDQPIHLAHELRKAIDRCFSLGSVPEILEALKNEPEGPTKEWADKTIATLHARSPTSVYVTLKQMQMAKEQKWTIAETFKREHQIAARFMRHHDFVEGVRAQVIDKDKMPKWQPASLEDISPSDKVESPFFEVSTETRPLQLLTEADYSEYPHRKFGLPTEEEVFQVLQIQPGYSREQIIELFLVQRDQKQGLGEVVGEIVDRNTRVNPNTRRNKMAEKAAEYAAYADYAEWPEEKKNPDALDKAQKYAFYSHSAQELEAKRAAAAKTGKGRKPRPKLVWIGPEFPALARRAEWGSMRVTGSGPNTTGPGLSDRRLEEYDEDDFAFEPPKPDEGDKKS